MIGSKTISMTPTEMRVAAKIGKSRSNAAKVQARAPYAWDHQDEADRPLSREEIQNGAVVYRWQKAWPVTHSTATASPHAEQATRPGLAVNASRWPAKLYAAVQQGRLNAPTPA